MAEKKRRRNIRWDKLDNTAHIFPSIAGESMTSVYRISVVLEEEVRPDLLQQALDMVLPKFDSFNVRMRKGVFWYYFEENGKAAPRVVEENTFPARFIEQNKNHNYLFRVTYYKCRINLEVFHVLTDGMGGLNFLRELTYQYLRLAHESLQDLGDSLNKDTSMNHEDSFMKNYRKSMPSGFEKRRAFQIRQEKLPAGELGIMHGYMPVTQLKEASHRYGVSINEYLIARYVYSVYNVCAHGMRIKQPIRVAVPVNLRPYYNSVTTKNFFVMVSAEFMPEKDCYSFEEVAQIIHESLRSQINKENLEDLFSYSVSNQMNLFLRPVPLPIKNFVIRMVYTKSAFANTSTITNIGNVKVDERYEPYIRQFHAFLAISKGQYLKGTICSYRDRLVFTFSSLYQETSVQRAFFQQIAEDGVDVEIETNRVYYD